MLIEKINENQIKIFLNLEDLDKNKITLHSFMCKSNNFQCFFSNILNLVHKEIGFKTINCKIITETFSLSFDNSFIMLISRVPENLNLHVCKNTLSSFKFKHHFWIDFSCLNNFCMFCSFLNFNFTSSLYLLNEHYFLHIKPKNLEQYFKLLNIAREFSNKIYNNNFTLGENAKCIIKENAVQTAQKYFA